nr:hypothetical protein [Peptoniphilus phoceensis]
MSNLKINISKDVLDFLEKKSEKDIFIDKVSSKQCCASGLPESEVYLGSSKRRDKDYNIFDYLNYKIYIDKELIFIDDICNIVLEKYAFTKTLRADFLDYKKLI